MELFSLLRNWKGGGGAPPSASGAPSRATTTIATAILRSSAGSDDDGGETEEDGSFIDLEFTVPVEDEARGGKDYKDYSASESESEEDEKELNFAMPSQESYKGGSFRPDRGLSFSPSDDIFFKGRLLPVEPSVPSSKPQFRAFLLRSATKLRVFAFRLKKTKSSPAEPNVASPAPTAAFAKRHQRKFFIKFKVEEVPIMSLFTRDNSSKSSSSSRSAKFHADDGSPASEEKRVTKDVVQKYLKKIKPFYVRVSKRYGEKLRFSGPLSSSSAVKVSAAEADGERGSVATAAGGTFKNQKLQGGNIPEGLRVVASRLRKSRSASSAVAAVRSPPRRRRDDSLLELQDGIQSAIAHCKRSYIADKELVTESEPPLVRSRSDPGDGRSLEGLGNAG
ncbi:probable membrane-associated kinase regulator 2 [Phoenix dactylifera]|uniref:Probable membrane-associated kinase regulator 2 n=1 Tax=Phoenix dactylifera TaxID=42345 RepID=A0A8B7D1Q2_PHODC|nr:probable membrane-associated kinase regulator 2 [Phoenix dactylifera]